MTLGSRKRVKPSPSGVDSPSPALTVSQDTASIPPDSHSQGRRATWYPGSWSVVSRSSKAAPVTEVARESISSAKNVASSVNNSSTSLHDTPKQSRHPSIQLTKKAAASTRSLPADATTTRVNIASNGSASTTAVDSLGEPAATGLDASDKERSEGVTPKDIERSAKEQSVGAQPNAPNAGHAAPSEQPTGWFSWFYRPTAPNKSALSAPTSAETTGRSSTEDQTAKHIGAQPTMKDPTKGEEQQERRQDQEQERREGTAANLSTAQKRSWVQMWYGSNMPAKQGEQLSGEPVPAASTNTNVPEASNATVPPPDQPKEPTESPGLPPVGTTRPSGWSFWSKDPSKDAPAQKTQEVQTIEASIPPGGQSKPMALQPDPEATVNTAKKGMKVKPAKEPLGANRVKDGSVSPFEATATPISPVEPRPAEATASRQLQRILPNQLLPPFKETYALEESPSIFQSLGRLLHCSKESPYKHVNRIKDPPRIKRAVAIGVHGFSPGPFIQNFVGRPTGTSVRFSNMAADAIHKWTADHGYSCEVEKIALEGEGRIAERVDLLWKLLLNWLDKIRKADFILVACHSQGVPVGIMLVAKLISFGCLNAARVGVCAMAGINLGPFPDYRSRWISGSAGELFEFTLPYSKVSKDYEAALRCALDFGVRITYIGSIDDQLVSLESSLFSPMAHPYVYRAVFVDGRVHAPSFLSHLVGFALKLRNLGIPDHGLVRELSSPLAGSLYTGEGHSRLYDDEAVYHMAIEFALETSSVPDASLHIKRSSPAVPSVSPNPYILPFAMRGLLEEEYVRRELHDETMELLRQFEDWKPASRVFKDVKFRLEGIRSKL